MSEFRSKKIVSNFIWKLAERWGAQLVTFVVQLILARILEPSVYGVIALIQVFINCSMVLVDAGLGTALIQKKGADEKDFSTVFWANCVICSGIYVIFWLVSPAIARAYEIADLSLYMRVLGISVLIGGIKNIQQAYVSKHMMFKKFFFATLAGTLCAGVIGVWMAMNGYGIWALIGQQLINMGIDTLVLWFTVKWRPERYFSKTKFQELFSYGWKILLSSFIDTLYGNLSQLMIGKVYDSESLAFYSQGQKFPNLIITNINSSIDSILLPTMSEAQD